jgi:hypothetical protein
MAASARLRFTITGEFDSSPENFDDDWLKDNGLSRKDLTPDKLAELEQENILEVTGAIDEVVDWADYGTLHLTIEPAVRKRLDHGGEAALGVDR